MSPMLVCAVAVQPSRYANRFVKSHFLVKSKKKDLFYNKLDSASVRQSKTVAWQNSTGINAIGTIT